MWPKQCGVTRKLLMTVIGFGILILSSLYLAKQSEELMIPYPLSKTTVYDIENLVTSDNAKLLFNDDTSPILKYVKQMSHVLANSIITNPPIYVWNMSDGFHIFDVINEYNGIFIDSESTLLDLLMKIEEPALCANYVYVTFDDWTSVYSALMMGKHRQDMLESMNAIVAERMSYVDNFIQSFQLDEKCRSHIFPVYKSNPRYLPLHLVKISGAFVFLFTILCVSVLVLLIELISARWVSDLETIAEDLEPININISIGNRIDTARRISFSRYLRIKRLLDDEMYY
jgi:hypothetical protein